MPGGGPGGICIPGGIPLCPMCIGGCMRIICMWPGGPNPGGPIGGYPGGHMPMPIAWGGSGYPGGKPM
eukprot:scaffold3291_cov109-Isochrysis_galbana.AAC.1